MPIYSYACEEHGEFEVFQRGFRESAEPRPCPECGRSAGALVTAAGVKIERTWNDKANDWQRTPYDQAKAQSWNTYHEQTERGIEAPKPTEAGIQEAAKQIARTKNTPRRSPIGQMVKERRAKRKS